MLKVERNVPLLRATDPQHGNVQTFLERLLVEAVAGNYRHFLHEQLASSALHEDAPEEHCWPPLLSNERQVGGLFATALSSVCPVSRPEVAIRRPASKTGKTDRHGSIDFVALFGHRYIGLEVKQVPMSTTAAGDLVVVGDRWNEVKSQSKGVMAHLRSDKAAYPHPVTIGLLVVRVSRAVAKKSSVEDARLQAIADMDGVVKALNTRLKPDFLARYIPPAEMQAFRSPKKTGIQVYPGIVFAAIVHGRQANKKKASAKKT